MLKISDFEQDCWSRTATCIYKNRHDNMRLMKRICFYDRFYYENKNYYHIMRSVCIFLSEISQR